MKEVLQDQNLGPKLVLPPLSRVELAEKGKSPQCNDSPGNRTSAQPEDVGSEG